VTDVELVAAKVDVGVRLVLGAELAFDSSLSKPDSFCGVTCTLIRSLNQIGPELACEYSP